MELLTAGVIYILIKKGYRVSRSERINWFLHHLNTKIRINDVNNMDCNDSEMFIISVIPLDPPKKWQSDSANTYEYLVTLSSNVIFVGEIYSFVYCLDLSPSVSAVDIQHGEVLIDLIVSALKKCVESLVKPLNIPGCNVTLKRDIYITVIAHTPFFITPAQQVLVQGWKLTENNLSQFMTAIQRQLEFMENAVAEVSSSVYEQLDSNKSKLDTSVKVNSVYSNESEKRYHLSYLPPKIAMISPGSGLLNLLRYGSLGLTLLPASNFFVLAVITDGMIIMPDIDTLDSVLNHMRFNDISCSFIHIGSQFHPHCGFGFVPYSEMMQLICVATHGSYLQFPLHSKQGNAADTFFQYCFFMWNMKRRPVTFDLSTPNPKTGEWMIENRHFYGNRKPQLLTKKHTETDINVSLLTILSCRIREGYVINDMSFKDNQLCITFILPWTNHIYIEYIVTGMWPISSSSTTFHCTMNVKCPYEFMHDVSCRIRTPIRSLYRHALITRFWSSLKSSSCSDALLSHLESFTHNCASYSLPDIIRNGDPLYHLAANMGHPILISNELTSSEFAQAWKPICLLDHNLWQKWFHTERIGVIFRHDENFVNVVLRRVDKSNENDCRQLNQFCKKATGTLFAFLKSKASFTLMENHSYVKFILPSELSNDKHSFFVIKIISKPPYATIHLAFLYNIPVKLRFKILQDLKNGIQSLKILETTTNNGSQLDIIGNTDCCSIVEKPLEKTLIRYEKMPNNFETIVFPDGTQPLNTKPVRMPFNNGLICTLSRYLHHRRWIWSASTTTEEPFVLSLGVLEKILSFLIQIRLKEGFRFTHCSDGIVNMMLEVKMKNSAASNDNNTNENGSDELFCSDVNHSCDNTEDLQTCLIQYILFPPNLKNKTKKSGKIKKSKSITTDHSNNENISEIITECWIEPQHGYISDCPPNRLYMSNLQYHQLPDIIWSVDAECISILYTFEYLRLLCENKVSEQPRSIQPLLFRPYTVQYWPYKAPFTDQRIKKIPFAFSVTTLCSKCEQYFLEMSLFVQDILDSNAVNFEPNRMLLESIFTYLNQLHSKVITVSKDDCRILIQRFQNKTNQSDVFFGSPASSGNKVCNPIFDEQFNTLPNAADWTRLMLWALDNECADIEYDYYGFPDVGSYDDDEDNLSDADGKYQSEDTNDYSLYDVQTDPDLYNVFSPLSDDEPSFHWNCYVKFTSDIHCIITLIPDSYETVRNLLFETDSSTQSQPKTSYKYYTNSSETSSTVDDLENSCNFSLSSEHSFDSETNLSANENDRKLLLGETVSMSSPKRSMRPRANTWDSIRSRPERKTEYRSRTSSLGAKSLPISPLQSKTTTVENSSTDLYSLSSSNDTLRRSKYVALPLPIYIYSCPIEVILNCLINKDEKCKSRQDLPLFELSANNTPASFSTANKNSSSPTYAHLFRQQDAELGNLFEDHYEMIETAFMKSYITTIFKALHHGYEVSNFDIQSTFDKCDESILPINITDYLKVVCGHMRHTVAKGNEHSNESESSAFVCPATCEMNKTNKFIKQRFLKTLATDFKPISSKSDSYYCTPSWAKELKSGSSDLLSSHTVDLNNCGSDSDLHGSTSEIPADDELKSWGINRGSETSGDDACTSLISNMDSNSSINDVAVDENLLEDMYPLFLKFMCHVIVGNEVKDCFVSIIPTCLCEIFDCTDKLHDFEDVTVILNVHCLTLPLAKPSASKVKDQISKKGILSDNKNDANDGVVPSSILMKNVSFEDGNVPKEILSLPDYQYTALSTCITQMEWIMKDEVVNALLDTWPPTLSTLKLVCDHIISSPAAPNCFVEKVPLIFVRGTDLSLRAFLQEFALMKIPDYYLEEKEDYYYLIKEEIDTDVSQYVSTKSELQNSTDNDVNFVSSGSNSSLDQIDDSVLDTPDDSENARLETFSDTAKIDDNNVRIIDGDNINICKDANISGHIKEKTSKKSDVNDVNIGTSENVIIEDTIGSSINEHGGSVNLEPDNSNDVKGIDKIEKLSSNSDTSSEDSVETVLSIIDNGSCSETVVSPVEECTEEFGLNSDPVDSANANFQESYIRLQNINSSKKCSNISSVNVDPNDNESIIDGNDEYVDAESNIKDKVESVHPRLPKFWLIMQVGNDHVIVYFHCRDTDEHRKDVKRYITVRETVINNIKDRCRLINQNMLLQHLYETRVCDPLLEPEIYQSEFTDIGDDEDDTTPDDEGPIIKHESRSKLSEIVHQFAPGTFACRVVWETKFSLHPRLKTSLKCALSRGIQALCSVLSRFQATNCKNLFVHRDESGSVFYLRLYEYTNSATKNQDNEETSSDSVSRSSSFSSLNRKQLEEQLPFIPEELRTTNNRSMENADSSMTKTDFLVLKVHGITEAGQEIKRDLVEVLQNRLDDTVIEVLSLMISRNPHYRLMPEDVHFIQKPQKPPNYTLRFRLHENVLNFIEAFSYFLRKYMLSMTTLPKYSDSKNVSTHFQDYVESETSRRVRENDIYLYNQNPSCGKGIACIALSIITSDGRIIETRQHLSYTVNRHSGVCRDTLDELKSLVDILIISSETNVDDSVLAMVQFRIWKQGRLNIELLGYKLSLAIRCALWEYIMELKLLVYPPVKQNSERNIVQLRDHYNNHLVTYWIMFGKELSISSINITTSPLDIKNYLNIVLKELNTFLAPYEFSTHLFNGNHDQSDNNSHFSLDYYENRPFGADECCVLISTSLLYGYQIKDDQDGEIFNKNACVIQLSHNDQHLTSKIKFIVFYITAFEMKLFSYNFHKDTIDNIMKVVGNINEWIETRSDLLTGIAEQKLGIFHSQPLYRDTDILLQRASQFNVENLLKYSPYSKAKPQQEVPPISQLMHVFKDVKLSNLSKYQNKKRDVFSQNIKQLKDLCRADKKGHQKYLINMWQTRNPMQNAALSEDMLYSFLSDSRLILYCLTPLLFLPRWRIHSAATRDHSLSLKTQSQLPGGEQLLVNKQEEKWHDIVCCYFVQEYKQYLLSLGFSPIQTILLSGTNSRYSKRKEKNIYYLQKSLLGGILLFEIYLLEPFFYAKLYALEYSRLKLKTSNPLVSQFAVSFLDECDRIKLQMHLHSFTYDYHLRCLHQFLTDQKPLLRDGYHVTNFLDDFLKYYPKPPNYARNLVFSDIIQVPCVNINQTKLFDFLLSHGKRYNMEPFSMKPINNPNSSRISDNEYVLVQKKSTPFICYKDVNDISQSDDFDVTVIVMHLSNNDDETTITAQFYILLTSRRELYPKLEIEKKLGKFRTVPITYPRGKQLDASAERYSDNSSSRKDDEEDGKEENKVSPMTSHIEIRQESVNYLGYYSSHEEVLQNLMMEQVEDVKNHIKWMFSQGTFDCVTQSLWNKLLSSAPIPLMYEELLSLLNYADVTILNDQNEEVEMMLNQSISKIQNTMKLILMKYAACSRIFVSHDGSTQNMIILHPRYSCGFIMFTLEDFKTRCVLSIVYRKGIDREDEAVYEINAFLGRIVNMCCYQIWLDIL